MVDWGRVVRVGIAGAKVVADSKILEFLVIAAVEVIAALLFHILIAGQWIGQKPSSDVVEGWGVGAGHAWRGEESENPEKLVLVELAFTKGYVLLLFMVLVNEGAMASVVVTCAVLVVLLDVGTPADIGGLWDVSLFIGSKNPVMFWGSTRMEKCSKGPSWRETRAPKVVRTARIALKREAIMVLVRQSVLTGCAGPVKTPRK
jgi:hypothetical protein